MLMLPRQILLALGLFRTVARCYLPRQAPANTTEHPPVPTASWPPLPSTFNDIPADYQDCWNSYFESSFTGNFLFTEFLKSSTRIAATFSPPRSGKSTFTYNQATDCSTTTLGLTTLCDAIPRASSRNVQCRTVQTTATNDWVQYQSDITEITPTWTSEFAKPNPTCTIAPDLSPMCGRMIEAYKWRISALHSETPTPTNVVNLSYMMVPPCTPLLYTPAPTANPLCRISAGGYSAYHWPTPTPTGSQFCNLNRTAPTGTPTIPGKPNTAVVSGHTLSSPSVYHFLESVKVETYLGYASQPNGLGPFPYEVWNLSTTLPSSPLTVAQLEPSILTASKSCVGREMDFCTLYLEPGFLVNDINTVRSAQYEKECSACIKNDGGAIYQSRYKPSIAVPVSEIVEQNSGVFGDCVWDTQEYNWEYDLRSSTSSDFPAVLVKGVERTDFVEVHGEVTRTSGEEVPVRTGMPAPGVVGRVAARPTHL